MSDPLPAFPVPLTVSEMGILAVLLQENTALLAAQLKAETSPTIRAYFSQRLQENAVLARRLSEAGLPPYPAPGQIQGETP